VDWLKEWVETAVVAQLMIPAHRRLREEDHGFEASLGYMDRISSVHLQPPCFSRVLPTALASLCTPYLLKLAS
jgi:hypothetical protein